MSLITQYTGRDKKLKAKQETFKTRRMTVSLITQYTGRDKKLKAKQETLSAAAIAMRRYMRQYRTEDGQELTPSDWLNILNHNTGILLVEMYEEEEG